MFINRQAGINAANQPKGANPGFGAGLLSFLQQPETLALAQGLLAGSQPSMTQPSTFGGALGQGFAAMQMRGDKEREKERELERLAILRGHLGVDQGKFGLEKQKFASEAAARAAEADAFRDLFDGGGSGILKGSAAVADNSAGYAPSTENASSGKNGEVTYTVQDPEINNGIPTQIPSSLNGRVLDEKEAKDIYKALEIQKELTSGTQQAGILNQDSQGSMPQAPQMAPPAPPAPSAPGNPQDDDMVTLGNGMQVTKEQLQKAKTYFALGKKDMALKTLLEGQDEQNLTGLPQEYASLAAIEKRYGKDSDIYKNAKEELDLRRANAKIQGESKEQITKLRKWNSLTADQKENVLAEGRTLGIPDQELLERYSKGESNYDIAKELGYSDKDARELDKNFAPTSATRTSIQGAEGALAEEQWIAPKITQAMKPYSRKIFGKSPAFLKDAYSLDPKTQAKVADALAARALQPEIAGFRSRAAGGSNAHGALQELTDKSLNELNIWEHQVSPEVYEMAQERLSEWIQGMGDARVKAMKGVKSQNSKSSDQISGTTAVYRNGKKYMIPNDQVQNALSSGGSLDG